jgi:hypothetical protein
LQYLCACVFGHVLPQLYTHSQRVSHHRVQKINPPHYGSGSDVSRGSGVRRTT